MPRTRSSKAKASSSKATRLARRVSSGSDAYEEISISDDDNARSELDSDALDDEDFEIRNASASRKRKRASRSPLKKTKNDGGNKKKNDGGNAKISPKNQRKKSKPTEDSDSDESGERVVGLVVKAPTTGRVPPGQISQNTLDFLLQLQDPECNDREWFKLNDPVYRQAELEWKDFIDQFTGLLTEVDPQVPPLPPRDVIHRIYRDIRFSNDKTPYKTNFSASFSRSGRKGIFAGYHVSSTPFTTSCLLNFFWRADAKPKVKPGGNSFIAGGTWCPGKNELASIRSHIQRNSTRLRNVLATPAFVALFGEAEPHPKGERRSIFGRDDELKVAPKGIDKAHPDIDLLKCRSFAVAHKFTDKQVLSTNFKNELARVVHILRPLVHCLNDYMTVGTPETDEEGED